MSSFSVQVAGLFSARLVSPRLQQSAVDWSRCATRILAILVCLALVSRQALCGEASRHGETAPDCAVPAGFGATRKGRRREACPSGDPPVDPSVRAASYSRFSSDMQRDESNSDQQRKCREKAATKGHDISSELEFSDEAVSGTKLHRDGLDAMLAAAKAGHHQYLTRLLKINQDAVAGNRQRKGRLNGSKPGAGGSHPRHLLSQLIVCEHCGRTFHVGGANGLYLFCPSYRMGTCSCQTQLRRDRAERMILAEIGERIGLMNAQIANVLGCSRSRLTKILKHWFKSHGQKMPDGRTRRATLKQKHVDAPMYQTIADDVMSLYRQDKLLQEIADTLNVDRNTVTAAIRWWHTVRDLPVPDGRTRRKELDRKVSRPRRPRGQNDGDDESVQ